MDDLSIFIDKSIEPNNESLSEKLGITYNLWMEIHDFVMEKYPGGLPKWYHSGKKYGWNYRIKDKRRAIIYLLPRVGYFKVAFVFGQKATDIILASDVSDGIKNELAQARKYAEGRGVSMDIKNDQLCPDVKKLVEIKLAN